MRDRIGSSEASEQQGTTTVLTAGPRVDPHVLGRLDPTARANAVLRLQRTHGNTAVQRVVAMVAREESGGGDASAKVLAGEYDGAAYKVDGTGFADAALDALLQETGGYVGVDTTLPPGTTGGTAEEKPKSGDTAGRRVSSQPPWVGAFQAHLSRKGAKWSQQDQTAQRLLRIYLNRWTEANAGLVMPSVAELYEAAGAHESHAATGQFGVAQKDAPPWCAQASSSAVAEAMLKAGLRFKKPPVPNAMKRGPERGYGRSRQTEINLQAGAFQDWMNTTGRKKGLQLSTEDARGQALNAGDILDLHSGAHPKGHTGHVATVVNALQAPKVHIVSGNAAGESVRVEEVTRGDPPKHHAAVSDERPPSPDEIWIFSLRRASVLNWFSLLVSVSGQLGEAEAAELAAAMDEYGLERCTPLDQMYSDATDATAAAAAAAE
jgi:hypothetical protein